MGTKYVFIHTKKVGGQSLIAVLGTIFGFDQIYIDNDVGPDDITSPVRAIDHPGFRQYTTPGLTQNRSRQHIRALLQSTYLGRNLVQKYRAGNATDLRTDLPPELFPVIAGHFPPGKYSHLKQSTSWITVVRNPIDRAVSHFKFLLTNPGDPPDGYYTGIQFADFARLPAILNYQTNHLRPYTLGSFDIVGTTKQIPLLAKFLLEENQMELVAERDARVPHLNRGACISIVVDPDLERFYERNSPDYHLHLDATRRGEGLLPDAISLDGSRSAIPIG